MAGVITLALAGNPNAGKTSLFNQLTQACRHVGNYPGVTVEYATGECRTAEIAFSVVDLPGTYSLSAYSPEELVARDYLLEKKPDVIINVVDATNLERNLFLTTQLMELEIPMVMALNMSDMADKRGIVIDRERLSVLLGMPIIPTVGSQQQGLEQLLAAVQAVLAGPFAIKPVRVQFPELVESALGRIREVIQETKTIPQPWPARWLALKVLEKDPVVLKRLDSSELNLYAEKVSEMIFKRVGETLDYVVADARYGFVAGAYRETVHFPVESRYSFSDRLDEILLNHYLGIPIFLGMMYLMFYFTFTVGNPLMQGIELFFLWLGNGVKALWPITVWTPLRALLLDGVLAGVGGVLVFLPNILCLFLGISLLEDTGYMSRAAFLMDRFMHRIGLHGKSFIPMLLGFGCSVPAIMATRILENRRDRLLTMLVIPLVSCGARLPIYLLIVSAFFPRGWQAPMVMLVYLIGIFIAIIAVRLLNKTLLQGESTPFVIELPPYRMPALKNVLLQMWFNAWGYIKKAGTVILGISILLWVLCAYPVRPANVAAPGLAGAFTAQQTRSLALEYSWAGRIGKGLEPILRTMGFDWRIGTALIGAAAAKEVFVAQLGIAFAVGEEAAGSLRQKIRATYSPLVGLCILLFTLIATPCMATVAITWKESGSWKWALFQFSSLTLLGYAVATLVYQLGRILGIGL